MAPLKAVALVRVQGKACHLVLKPDRMLLVLLVLMLLLMHPD